VTGPGQRPRRAVAVSLASLALGLLVALSAAPAQARLIDLYAGPRAGGMIGWGSRSTTPDFFEKARGAALGAEVGVKVLVLNLSVSFLQMLDGSGRSGTLSQALLGFELDIPIGNPRSPEERRKLLLRPGAGAGVGFGTPGPVRPPLSNDQISDKGFITQGKLALEYNPNVLLGFGVEGAFGYHYFVGAQAANNVSTHSAGYQMTLLGTATLHLGY
jgi:hypothetical protein